MLFSSSVFLFLFPSVSCWCITCPAEVAAGAERVSAAGLPGLLCWGSLVCTGHAGLHPGNYGFGLWVDACKRAGRTCAPPLVTALAVNLGILFVFKYLTFTLGILNRLGAAFVIPGIELPIGISFFTFQALSYVLDVHRDRGEVQRSPLKVGLYISFFPQLIAGPIVKYETVAQQIDHRKEIWRTSPPGAAGLSWVWARRCSSPTNWRWWPTGPLARGTACPPLSPGWAPCATPCRSTTISPATPTWAIGLGKMFGFHFLENFNYPYISRSITEFWRRWHISLSTWFREYLYIPLGGQPLLQGAVVLNLFLVWAATGIWHGASWNFVLWGLYFWVLLLVEKFVLLRWLKRASGAVGHLYTLFFVLVSWTIFAIEDFGQLGEYLKVMFGLGGVPLIDGAFKYYAANYLPVLCISALAATPLGAAVYRRLMSARPYPGAVLILAGLLLCTAYLVDGTYNPSCTSGSEEEIS